MKKTILASCFLLISFISSYGQWYVKKYKVTDINFLTKQQLDESLSDSKKDLLTFGGITAAGGVIFVIFKYLHPGMSDDPSFTEQLIGDKGVNTIGMVSGIAISAVGAIGSIAYIGRIGKIKSVIRNNYPSVGLLNISPAIISNSYTRKASPGIALTYNF
jgi:hypothetical protein